MINNIFFNQLVQNMYALIGDGADTRFLARGLAAYNVPLALIRYFQGPIVTIQPNAAPKQLAAKTYDPKAFTDAYVAGLAGTHFTLELSIKGALPKDVNQATIKVTYTDAATGATFTKQTPAKVQR